MPSSLDKLEENYLKFHEFLKNKNSSLVENEAFTSSTLSLDSGLGFLRKLCSEIETIAHYTSSLEDSELDAISRCIARFHSLVHQWITPALINSDNDKLLQPLLEAIFCKHAFLWPVAMTSFSAFLRVKSSQPNSFNSSTTVTLWLNLLNKLLSRFDFTDCLTAWGCMGSNPLKHRRLLFMTCSLFDAYLAIPALVSNSRLEIAQPATSKLVLSNFLSHTGRLLDKWLTIINTDNTFQLGLFSRILQKVHRIGYLDGIISALGEIPPELLLHKDFHIMTKPFLQSLLQATDLHVDGLALEGFGSKVDPTDPVGRLIRPIAGLGFDHTFIRNAVLPLLVDVKLTPPLPARLATHVISLSNEELFSQLLHFLFTNYWPSHDFFLWSGVDAYQSRCFLFAFLISKAPVSAFAALAGPVNKQISLALESTDQETRHLQLILAQTIINKARTDGQAILDLPHGELSSRAKLLTQLLTGDVALGPDLQTAQPKEEASRPSPALAIAAKFPMPRYLNDAILYLKTSVEDDRFHLGVAHIFPLIQSADIGTLNEVAPDLIRILLNLPSPELRAKSMALVLMRSFKYSARSLVELLYTDMVLDLRVQALVSLRQAVLAIAEPPSEENHELRNNQSNGVVTWQSARLVLKSISNPTAEGRGLFPSQLFFPLIRPLRIGGKLSYSDVILLEAILMLLSTTMYFSYHLPEQGLMEEAYMGLLGHLRLHPDPKIQAAVLLGYSAVLPRDPSPRWHSLGELPSILDYCQDLTAQSKHKDVVRLSESVTIQIAKIVDNVRSKTFV